MLYAYTTVSGDTWDRIALEVYGDAFLVDFLLKEPKNLPLLDYQVFPAGVKVYVPEITVSDVYEEADMPAWRAD